MTITTLTLQGNPQTTFTVRVVRKGQFYGRYFDILHEREDPLVEFYDKAHDHCKFGQFVSRYFLRDILAGSGGLLLDTGSPDWRIDPEPMAIVRAWLEEVVC